jgi:hypothetical protein
MGRLFFGPIQVDTDEDARMPPVRPAAGPAEILCDGTTFKWSIAAGCYIYRKITILDDE